VAAGAPGRDNAPLTPLSARSPNMTDILNTLGSEADDLLGHVCKGIPADHLLS